MINFNGQILDDSQVQFGTENRAFKYGDAVFESMKFSHGKIIFWEDHYFRLMSSMRILRMEIPMNFSPEYLEEQIVETISANHAEQNPSRVRLAAFRIGAGNYAPEQNEISFVISVQPLANDTFELNERGLKIDLFKDHYKQKSLLANLKTANSLLYVLAGVFKTENNLDECILLNDSKEVVESISANIFMVKGQVIFTPPISSGCLKGVMRKNILKIAKNIGFEIREEAFSPFELQRADEVFLSNAIQGIRWVANYRKKEYTNEVAIQLSAALNSIV